MAKLTAKQLYALAREAGFSRSEAISATAIALAESKGDANTLNDNPGSGDLSYGLWQINMIGTMGPERRRQFGIGANDDLFDPHVNARAAYQVYKQQGFGAWSVWPEVRKFSSPESQAALKAADAESGLDAILKGIPGKAAGAVVGAAQDAFGGALSGIVSPLTEGFRRVAIQGAFVTLGLVLLGMGAWQAVGPSVKRTVGAAGGAAGGVAAGAPLGPAGMVVGGVGGAVAGRAAVKKAQEA